MNPTKGSLGNICKLQRNSEAGVGEPIEIGYRGFTRRSLCKMLSKSYALVSEQTKSIRKILMAVEVLWLKRSSRWQTTRWSGKLRLIFTVECAGCFSLRILESESRV